MVGIWLFIDMGTVISWLVQACVTEERQRYWECRGLALFLWCAFSEEVKARFLHVTQNQSILFLVWGWSSVQFSSVASLMSWSIQPDFDVTFCMCFGIVCGGRS